MKVFITGATGFVGAHSARNLLDAGHEVRLLVRNADAARDYFTKHGYAVDDLVVADMRDEAAVRQGMRGCDAVLHSAAAVTLSAAQAQATYDNNVGGMRAVIGAACSLGIGRIVYVSSLAALFQPGLSEISEQTPLGSAREPYARSKTDADRHVRELQAQGAPISITYPGSVIGPDDPRLSESNFALVSFLGTMVPRTTTGIQFVDVRDVAQAHRLLLERPPAGVATEARYILGGHYYPWVELRDRLQALTGRRLRSPRIPGPVLRAMGRSMDLMKRVVPFESPLTTESAVLVTQWTPANSAKLLAETGMDFRSGDESLADAIRWLAANGHLKPELAGALRPAALAA
jgi:dihydroflavonol-4-reductase